MSLIIPSGKFRHRAAATAGAVSAALVVSPPAPAAGQVVTAAYTVTGNGPGGGQTATLAGNASLPGGGSFPATVTFTVPGTPAAAVSYATPSCPGLAFTATANPAVFTAVASPAPVSAATVSGSVVVAGTAYPVSAAITLPASGPAASSCLLGIYDPADDFPSNWAGIQAFQNAGLPVKVATYYVQWNGSFPVNLANLAWQNGQVIPFVELEPWFSSSTWPNFTDIAAGKYDSWLQQMAQSVVAYGHPCYFTYAHEQNGSWYPWGNGGAQKVTAAQWVASWQHVVSVMNAVPGAASLITWVWAPNNADVGSVVPYWPGQQYVGLAAWDGYLNQAGQTYASFLAQTLKQIRTLTSGPVWLAETGVEPAGSGRAARITGLISDLHAAGVNGFNWFNQGVFALTAGELSAFSAAVKAWNGS